MYEVTEIKGLENFDTSSATTMECMFTACQSLSSLDISSFNTSNVTNMRGMFYGSSNLTTIYVGNGWTTQNVTNSEDMFYNCGTSDVTLKTT